MVANPVASERTLRIIHISDLHIFTPGTIERLSRPESVQLNQYVNNTSLQQLHDELEVLKRTIKGLIADKFQQFGGATIIVTGDVAYSGHEDEYFEARKFFDELTDIVGTEGHKAPIYFAPGNHDVDQLAKHNRLEDHQEICEGRAKRAEEFYKQVRTKNGISDLREKLREFYKFSQPYQGASEHEEASYEVHVVRLPGSSNFVNYVALNSSLLFGGPVKYLGFLGLIPVQDALRRARTIVGAQGGDPDKALSVVFFHHPFEAQASVDLQRVQQEILNNATLVLVGHVHEHYVYQRMRDEGVGPDLPIYSAARCVYDAQGEIGIRRGFTLLEIDYDDDGATEIRIHQVPSGNAPPAGWDAPRGEKRIMIRKSSGPALDPGPPPVPRPPALRASLETSSYLIGYLKHLGYHTQGHFILADKSHSDTYAHVRVALMHERVKEAFAIVLANELRREANPDGLAACTIGGTLLARKVAEFLGGRGESIPVIYGQTKDSAPRWKSPYNDDPSYRTLSRVAYIVDFMTTPTASEQAILALWNDLKVNVKSVGVGLDRRSKKQREAHPKVETHNEKVQILSAASEDLNAWPVDNQGRSPECQVCKDSVYRPRVSFLNPEEDFFGVLSSLLRRGDSEARRAGFATPENFAEFVMHGYSDATRPRRDGFQWDIARRVVDWKSVVPTMLKGLDLPESRLRQDCGFLVYLNEYLGLRHHDPVRKGAIADVMSHLMATATSEMSCQGKPWSVLFLMGADEDLDQCREKYKLENIELSQPPMGTKELQQLSAPYKRFLGSNIVGMFRDDGAFVRLCRETGCESATEGRTLRAAQDVRTFALDAGDRKRKTTIASRYDGQLIATAVLNEDTGTWDFNAEP